MNRMKTERARTTTSAVLHSVARGAPDPVDDRIVAPSHVTLPPPARGQVRRSGLVRLPGPLDFKAPLLPRGAYFFRAHVSFGIARLNH